MHLLHVLIAKIILETDLPGCEVIFGKDCDGDQYIQLFANGQADMATRFCSVDAIILKEGKVQIIIEIEESDIRPVALCGKVLVSAHTSHFIHRGKSFPIAPRASFVQVIDTKNLSKQSSKLDQCPYLRDAIRDMLSKTGNIQDYEIFHGDIAEFDRTEAQQELRDHIRAACFQDEPVRIPAYFDSSSPMPDSPMEFVGILPSALSGAQIHSRAIVCCSMIFRSSRVSGPSLSRMRSGTASLPISCTRPPQRSATRRFSGNPSFSASATEYFERRSQCPSVPPSKDWC